MRRAPAHAWYNLGIAYQRLGKYEPALAAYERAAAMEDATKNMQQAAQDLKEYQRIKKAAWDFRGPGASSPAR